MLHGVNLIHWCSNSGAQISGFTVEIDAIINSSDHVTSVDFCLISCLTASYVYF